MDSLPDFNQLAESYGHVGIKIDHPDDVEGALRDVHAVNEVCREVAPVE